MCDLGDGWDRVHFWVRHAASDFHSDEWRQVEDLAKRILELLNDSEASNSVKIVALAHLAIAGAAHIESQVELMKAEDSPTIH